MEAIFLKWEMIDDKLFADHFSNVSLKTSWGLNSSLVNRDPLTVIFTISKIWIEGYVHFSDPFLSKTPSMIFNSGSKILITASLTSFWSTPSEQLYKDKVKKCPRESTAKKELNIKWRNLGMSPFDVILFNILAVNSFLGLNLSFKEFKSITSKFYLGFVSLLGMFFSISYNLVCFI